MIKAMKLVMTDNAKIRGKKVRWYNDMGKQSLMYKVKFENVWQQQSLQEEAETVKMLHRPPQGATTYMWPINGFFYLTTFMLQSWFNKCSKRMYTKICEHKKKHCYLAPIIGIISLILLMRCEVRRQTTSIAKSREYERLISSRAVWILSRCNASTELHARATISLPRFTKSSC